VENKWMPCSQIPKHEDMHDELKDLGERYKEMANNFSAVTERSITGFISFVEL
jgi:hypothetical protein